jgi:hypothetical protein
LAQVEALIDFGEGEDLEEGVYDQGKWIRAPLEKVYAYTQPSVL